MSGAAAMSTFRERFGGPADSSALVSLINVAFRPEQIAIEGDRISAAAGVTWDCFPCVRPCRAGV